jgi:hypothetical protein
MSQLYTLFNLLKAVNEGEYISKDDVISVLKVNAISIPVYVFELKKQFGVKVESQYQGKRIIGYRLAEESKSIVVPDDRKRGRKKKLEVKPKVDVIDDYSIDMLMKELGWVMQSETVNEVAIEQK